MDENADASQAIFEPAPENWRTGRPRTTWMKNIHDDLSSLDLGIHEAKDLAQNRPLCRLMSLHSDYALVVIPAKAFARDYVITGVGLSVCLFVCLFVTTITK